MKKRFKIIMTSAMLAMSLALMAFGVYAASAVTLQVNNYIQFDLGSHIECTVEAASLVTNAAPATYAAIAGNAGAKKYSKTLTVANVENVTDTWTPWTSDASAHMTVGSEHTVWVFKITNTGSNKIKASITNTDGSALVQPASTKYNFQYGANATADAASFEFNETTHTSAAVEKNGVIYLYVDVNPKSTATSIDVEAWNFRVHVEYAA